MFLKRKHIAVVFFSSGIIALVLLSTLIGYNLYMQWKKDTMGARYRNTIYRITAQLFKKDIILSNVNVRMTDKKFFSPVPIIEGGLKNNSNKAITSVLVEVIFQDSSGKVLYKDWFNPMSNKQNSAVPIFSQEADKTGNILLPGEGISFRHLMVNCPGDVAKLVKEKSSFARKNSEDKVHIFWSVEGLSVI